MTSPIWKPRWRAMWRKQTPSLHFVPSSRRDIEHASSMRTTPGLQSASSFFLALRFTLRSAKTRYPPPATPNRVSRTTPPSCDVACGRSRHRGSADREPFLRRIGGSLTPLETPDFGQSTGTPMHEREPRDGAPQLCRCLTRFFNFGLRVNDPARSTAACQTKDM
jgi:hypothetical protein